jgi:hypothetical protein
MTTLDFWEIKEELCVFLRNQNALTIAERGVTTQTDSGTYTNATSHTISRTNVRNIRSITIAAVLQVLGTDFTVEYTGTPGATQNCIITYLSTKNGAYSIVYDYGADRIFPDYPRDDLTIKSVPRVSVDVLASDSSEASLGGGSVVTNVSLTITAFAESERKVESIIKTIRNAFLANKKSFIQLKFITVIGMGPMLLSPNRRDKIVQRNIDLMSPLNFEE